MENNSELLIYQTSDGVTKIEVKLEDETVWLSQGQICELFQKSKSTVSEHIKHIYEEGELQEISTVRKFHTFFFAKLCEKLIIKYFTQSLAKIKTQSFAKKCNLINKTCPLSFENYKYGNFNRLKNFHRQARKFDGHRKNITF